MFCRLATNRGREERGGMEGREGIGGGRKKDLADGPRGHQARRWEKESCGMVRTYGTDSSGTVEERRKRLWLFLFSMHVRFLFHS